MPLFHYRALTPDGESIEGEMEAGTQDAVISRLHEAGQIPVHMIQISEPGNFKERKKLFGTRRELTSRDVSLLTSKLSIMLHAGLPLDNALGMLADLIPPGPGRKILEKIRAAVQNGAPLSEAMQAHPDVFNRLYISTVRAGEAAGALDTVLARLADYLERSRELRETVISALIYPAILLVVALFSLAILMIYVVPQFSDLFEGMNQALPVPTAMVIAASNLLQKFWWLILVLLILISYGVKWMYRNPDTRKKIDGYLLKLPLIADLITKIEVARFSRTLGTLTANGVPLLNSLNIVRESIGNTLMREAVGNVSEQLRIGKGMSRPLSATGLFPTLAVQLIHVGEETGELDKMLNQLADIYDNEVRETVKRLLTLLEPALIIGLGIIIAVIILSILLAILGLNEFVV